MFTSGILEEVITEKSGHRSLTALRAYEKISEDQQEEAGSALEQSTVYAKIFAVEKFHVFRESNLYREILACGCGQWA